MARGPEPFFSERGEGTVEFKFKNVKGEPRLDGSVMRGNQKAALIEYHEMGGGRRWVLTCNGAGVVRLYNTRKAVGAVKGSREDYTDKFTLDDPRFVEILENYLRKH